MRQEASNGQAVGLLGRDIHELQDLVLKGLARMFDPSRQLFCYRLKCDDHGQLIREGHSRRYSIISLLGLASAESAGLRSPVDIRKSLQCLLSGTTWITNIGDLGLLLWLCALVTPEQLNEICSSMGVREAFTRYGGERESRTMELAWFLSGLAHATIASPSLRPVLTASAVKAYEELEKNQGEKGIFGHLRRRRSLAGVVRGRIGSFADQVYPIYALTRYAQAYDAKAALDRALLGARAVCRTQGSLGQWWWHYDALSGRVLQTYPVYAVHQDGMAPMALFAIGEAAGVDFTGPIYKGLAWIYGHNELNFDMRETSSGVIWRSFYRRSSMRRYVEEARNFISPGFTATNVNDLAILNECRPYHPGWLLYALAGRAA
jgi:hypothetical protein